MIQPSASAMDIRIAWDALAFIGGGFTTLWAAHLFVVRLLIKNNNVELLKQINGTYVRTELCRQISKMEEQRLGTLEEKQDDVRSRISSVEAKTRAL